MTTPPRPSGDEPPVSEPQSGGDPVCWLARVCPECGQFVEDPRVDPESHCPTSTR
ncbi:hypothetical protein AB0J40_07320 [Amycolatopsis sp. NPDC049691]|uniref:hypothetical protein n=1 Tax=Amycolatopsis sp. NPDC049691 TaxID=3155155 RepID=UPI0034467DBA